jgi:CheY-like chemotaxis protein
MKFFDLSPIIEQMLASGKNISGLKFSVGHPPRVEINKKFLPVAIKGLRSITPYQAEIISMALIGRNTRTAEELVKTGLVYGYFSTNHQRTQFRIKLSQSGTYSVVMRPVPMIEEFNPVAQPGDISQDNVLEAQENLLQAGFDWAGKHLHICVAEPSLQEIVEKVLNPTKVEVTVTHTAAQAIDNLQHHLKSDIVLLDPQFDNYHHGGIALLRHFNSFSPQFRRRTFVVLLSPQIETMDTYMAFLNCVNLTFNTKELKSFPTIIEKSINDFNKFYRSFYEAGGSSPF